MPVTVSSRERYLRVLRGQDIDRLPIFLWCIDPTMPPRRPAWQPLHDLVEEFALDVILDWYGTPPVSPHYHTEDRETSDPEWREQVLTIETPAGSLTQRLCYNLHGKPGYVSKYFIESVEDARRWLAMPEPELPPVEGFFAMTARLGDRGMVQVGLSEPMYMVNCAMGSELWAMLLYDERELLHEMVDTAAREMLRLVRHYLEHGLGPVFNWYGPEVCIPPLASPRDFDDFVTPYDKPIIDLVHDAGGLFRVHCHGDMHPVLERFAAMGVDGLDPIEPPPVGRLTLAEAKGRVGERMTLVGGVETSDIELDSPEELAAIVERTVEMGKPGGRFILAPCATHDHLPDMSARIAYNYRVFVETAVRMAEY